MSENAIIEADLDGDLPDPDATPIKDRRVVTQPYDLVIETIISQIKSDILFLRPLSERPKFQRQYVWPDKLASRLIESILLNVPIPPCYLSQNEDGELDVIDGQQRLFSVFRYVENQFSLLGLEAYPEFNGKRFFELPSKEQRKIRTHTLRCVLVTNESHPEIKYDIFERLNTSTMPLNAQELRNCVLRGALNELVGELSFDQNWLKIRGRKLPDKRLADEELILRFFSFQLNDRHEYRTPLKSWLNATAKAGRKLNSQEVERLRALWKMAISNSLIWFEPLDCFRRPNSKPINRALYDLIMFTASQASREQAVEQRLDFLSTYREILSDQTFSDLISRSVDHKKRTDLRFDLWTERMATIGL